MAKLDFGRVGVLMGGVSTERGISLKSGNAVLQSLKKQGLDAVALDIENNSLPQNIWLIKNSAIDVAFVALHGSFGEDGQIQEILEGLDVPYTGSGVMASRLALDKIASRRIFQIHNLCVPRYAVIHRLTFHKGYGLWEKVFDFPVVVKPANQGSSIGLSITDSRKGLKKALDLAFSLDETVLVEEYIRGREVTVGILKNLALPVVEIKPKNRFFDYRAKYTLGMTRYIVPAKIKDEESRRVKQHALAAHRFLGCEGFSRVDVILKDGCPYILEVNTIPGLTETSLLPKAAKTAGIPFDSLCLRLVKSAYEKKKN
jgi:D-alanine-D-alanine ligase